MTSTVVRLPGNQAAVTGTLAEVAEMLARAQAAGILVAAGTPVPTGEPGQVMVHCRLTQPRPAATVAVTSPARRVPVWVWVGLATLVMAFLAGVAWLIVQLIVGVAAGASAGGVLVLLALVVLVLLGRGVGSGRTFSGTFKGKIH